MQKIKNVEDRVHKILIVDDEREILSALYMTLSRTDRVKTDIQVASDGISALQRIDEHDFDVIISDYKMPNMNGIDFLMEAKKKDPSIMRILITGYSDVDTAKDAINKAQVHYYIEKPWDNDELISTISEAVCRKQIGGRDNIKKADTVSDAIGMLKQFQEDLVQDLEPDCVPKQKFILEFDSINEFNKFSLEIKKMRNMNIEDIQVFQERYIITVGVYPRTYEKIS